MQVDPVGFVLLCVVCAALGCFVGWMGGVIEGRQRERRRSNVCAETGAPKDPRGCWNVRCQLGDTCCRAAPPLPAQVVPGAINNTGRGE
jgi:hypothetical protein